MTSTTTGFNEAAAVAAEELDAVRPHAHLDAIASMRPQRWLRKSDKHAHFPLDKASAGLQ